MQRLKHPGRTGALLVALALVSAAVGRMGYHVWWPKAEVPVVIASVVAAFALVWGLWAWKIALWTRGR